MQVRANIDPDETYSMLLLTPELQASLQAGELYLRSEEDENAIAACTTEHTFRLRRLNQSNNLFLSNTDMGGIDFFASPNIILESFPISGKIPWDKVPPYESDHKTTLQYIRDNSECSQQEFDTLWRQKPGVVVDGFAYVLDADVVHNTMLKLVEVLVSADDPKLTFTAEQTVGLIDDIRPEIVGAVYHKFAKNSEPGLDLEELYRWTGKYLLARSTDGMFTYEFKQAWNIELSCLGKPRMEMIEGSYIETKPGFVKYFDATRLAPQARDRFAELFNLKSEWLLDDIAPFIADLVPSTSKLESWVLKFSRRTKKGKDYYVSARNL